MDRKSKALSKLVTGSPGVKFSRGSVQRQRASFAFGNANIEGQSFSRATVTMAALPDEDSEADSISLEPIAQNKRRELELGSLLRQFDLMVELIEQHTNQDSREFLLTPEIIVSLQSVLAFPGGPQPGFRAHEVRISTNDFTPIPSVEVSSAIGEMCEYVNANWSRCDAVELSAYTLWRLNWIHPFSDGNGRTARALSYLILSVKLGSLLPGSPTIPEQLMVRRGDYFDALAQTDELFKRHSKIDVSPISALLRIMLLRQLETEPALSDAELEQISATVDRRINTANRELVCQYFGDHPVEHRLWSIDDHLMLHVGSSSALSHAEACLISAGEPFPKLFAFREKTALRSISSREKGVTVEAALFDGSSSARLLLEHNSAIIIQGVDKVRLPQSSDSAYETLAGTLYVVRFGREIGSGRTAETLDFLVTKHLMAISK